MLKNFEVNGEPVWRDTSPRVVGEVKTRHSKGKDALDRWEFTERKRMDKKNAVPKFGIIPYVELKTIDGGPMPTKREWITAMETGTWNEGNTKRLASGEVVELNNDPEKMAAARKNWLSKRRKRPPSR